MKARKVRIKVSVHFMLFIPYPVSTETNCAAAVQLDTLKYTNTYKYSDLLNCIFYTCVMMDGILFNLQKDNVEGSKDIPLHLGI